MLSKPANTYAFRFSHKQLFGGNHTDNSFQEGRQQRRRPERLHRQPGCGNVGYLFTGHDHMHNLSVVTSPDGTSQVHQVIRASDSYKFYTPVVLSNHGIDSEGYNAGQISKNRELKISQELWSTGYYIVTVDGPRVTVDFHRPTPIPTRRS